MKNYTSEVRAELDGVVIRELITFEGVNVKGETIAVELCRAEPLKEWKRKFPFNYYYSITVYATDSKGNCWGRYNPQITADHKINYDYILEFTPENRKKIIDLIYKAAFTELERR